MTNENLKQIMDREWQKVRKNFHYPQLPHPRLIDSDKTAGINMKSLEVNVSEPFIKGFENQGISSEESLNEILTHELIHFMKYPGSVLNILRLQKSAQGIVDANKITGLRNDYLEAQTRLDMMVGSNLHPSAYKMARACIVQEIEPSPSGKIMWGVYQEVTEQNLGIKLKKNEKELAEKLKEINYLDKKQETFNFRSFVKIMKDYQPSQKKENLYFMGQNDLERFSDNQIREGLKQFAKECSSPEEYEEIVKQVFGEMQNEKVGREAGFGKGIVQLAENFYTALSEKYIIPIRKKPMHKNGNLYPHSHSSFEVGDSITEVDAFSTPGILPGITKKWVKKEGEVYGEEEGVPDSFLVIDSSSSMPNSCEEISIPVLGATAISNAYLWNSAEVAIYNFGGSDHFTNFTRDRKIVHEELRKYTSGGTNFNPSFLETVLKETENFFDLSIISDMEIYNLDDFITSVLTIPQTHRIHLFYTDNNNEKLRQSFGKKENVAILPLTCEADIQKITMGELKKSIR
ncbi:hypothetical protein KAT24_02295 [Candidatus Pacearchaeota archaeon]|nr:hypothetical protein [Candidatus Pacearchaeota archaeon]